MTQDQVAINASATRNLAARLEARHYPGDPQTEAETIVRGLLADGLAPIRRPEPIPQRGNGGSDAARRDALAATAAAVAAAKARNGGVHDGQPMAGPRDLTRLAILLSQDGVKERQARLDWCGAMVGRTLMSSTDLTRTEARFLIGTLEVPTPDDVDGEEVTAEIIQAEDELEPDMTDDDYAGEPLDDDEPVYSYAGGPDDPPF